jgi:2-polyprenyl-3-methyl-5-hydroxy-6-metoxy-1,4-benzoquinol methylase
MLSSNQKHESKWKCPICTSAVFYQKNDYYSSLINYKNINLVTCVYCTTKSLYPMPTQKQLNKLNKHYWKKADRINYRTKVLLQLQAGFRIKYLKNHIDNLAELKILDIGSGPAYMYDILREENKSLEYSVVEYDKSMNNLLREKGIRKIYSSLQTIGEFDFEMIILSHILEHLREPTQVLHKIKELTNKDAFLLIEVPNRDDYFKRDLGAHLFVFNQHCMIKMFEINDMQLLDIVTVGENIETLHKLKESLTYTKFRNLLKKYFPVFGTIKDSILDVKDSLNEKRLRNNLISHYKLNSYNDNGNWIRAIGRV